MLLIWRCCVLCLAGALLQACTTTRTDRGDGPPDKQVDISSIPDAVPKVEPKSRYGNPESYVVNGNKYHVSNSSNGYIERGIASWYGRKFHGRRTSSGETYDMYAMTAAHKTLPLPTYVEVRNLGNGRRVIVRINDRGPFHENRVIDLSYTAALKLDIVGKGTGLVEVRAIDPGREQPEFIKAQAPVANLGNGFYVQVGSFARYDNALKLRNRLAGLADGLIQISEATVSNEKLYRVRFGPITEIDVADQIVTNLHRYGINEHRIVIDL